MDIITQMLLIGGTCIATTCLGIYWGIMIGTGQVRWLKVTRKRK
jgi:hypothetical protein